MPGVGWTPGSLRAAVNAALASRLASGGDSDAAIRSRRPVQPAKAPRSAHSPSYAVTVDATADDEARAPDPGGSRAVIFGINVALVLKTSNPGAYDASLDGLYSMADDVFQALMGEGDPGWAFGCTAFEFDSMEPPTQGDAEYTINLRFTARGCWPVS